MDQRGRNAEWVPIAHAYEAKSRPLLGRVTTGQKTGRQCETRERGIIKQFAADPLFELTGQAAGATPPDTKKAMKMMAMMVPVMGALSRLKNGMVTNGRRGGTILFSKTDSNLRLRFPLPSELIKLPPNFSPFHPFSGLRILFHSIFGLSSAPRSVSQSVTRLRRPRLRD